MTPKDIKCFFYKKQEKNEIILFLKTVKRKHHWKYICRHYILPVSVIEMFQAKICWSEVGKFQKLSERFIEKFQDKVDWKIISTCQKLSERFIEKFQEKVDWGYISEYQKLSERFIEKFQDKVDWKIISTCQKLSERFIEKFQDKVDWEYISEYQKLSECFIEKFQDKTNWDFTYSLKVFSERFIEKFQDKVDWDYIVRNQKLSESFIQKFQDKVDWDDISQYQKLSEDFIIEHLHKLDWYYIKRHQNITKNLLIWLYCNDELEAFAEFSSKPGLTMYSKKNSKTIEVHHDRNLYKRRMGIKIKNMKKTSYEYLQEFCKIKSTSSFNKGPNPRTPRVEYLVSELNKLDVEIHEDEFFISETELWKYINLYVVFKAKNPDTTETIIFLAHHDIANSDSENCQDNSASVCNLLEFCSVLKNLELDRNIIVCFTDGEEPASYNSGAGRIAKLSKNKEGIFNDVKHAINLELTGCGRTVWFDFYTAISQYPESKLVLEIQNKLEGVMEVGTPFSDSYALRHHKLDSVCIGLFTPEDVQDFNFRKYPKTWRLCHSTEDTIEKISADDMSYFVNETLIKLI